MKSNIQGIKPVFGHTIRLQNTGDLFYCDREDWTKAVACKWWLTKELRLINKSGVYFEDYVGIKGIHRKNLVEPLDFSRDTYIKI